MFPNNYFLFTTWTVLALISCNLVLSGAGSDHNYPTRTNCLNSGPCEDDDSNTRTVRNIPGEDWIDFEMNTRSAGGNKPEMYSHITPKLSLISLGDRRDRYVVQVVIPGENTPTLICYEDAGGEDPRQISAINQFAYFACRSLNESVFSNFYPISKDNGYLSKKVAPQVLSNPTRYSLVSNATVGDCGEYLGFNCEAECVHRITILPGDLKEVTPPGYPELFLPNLNCWWIIYTHDNSKSLNINLRDVNIPHTEHSTSTDYVRKRNFGCGTLSSYLQILEIYSPAASNGGPALSSEEPVRTDSTLLVVNRCWSGLHESPFDVIATTGFVIIHYVSGSYLEEDFGINKTSPVGFRIRVTDSRVLRDMFSFLLHEETRVLMLVAMFVTGVMVSMVIGVRMCHGKKGQQNKDGEPAISESESNTNYEYFANPS